MQDCGLVVETANEFNYWLRNALPQSVVQYFQGNQQLFLAKAGPRIFQLQHLADEATAYRPRPPSEAVELQQLLDQREVISLVQRALDNRLIDVVRTPLPAIDGEPSGQWVHYAVRRR